MIDIMVTLKPEFASVAERVAEQLSKDGLVVERVYPFGVIKGRASSQIMEKMRNYQEVENVSEEKTARITPPGDLIQ